MALANLDRPEAMREYCAVIQTERDRSVWI